LLNAYSLVPLIRTRIDSVEKEVKQFRNTYEPKVTVGVSAWRVIPGSCTTTTRAGRSGFRFDGIL
jgi:hypothetical protein